MAYNHLILEKEENIGIVKMNRPPVNALNSEVVEEISKPPLSLVCWDVRNPITLELVEFHEV